MSGFGRIRVATLFGALAGMLLSLLVVAPGARAAVSDCSQWGVTSLQGDAYRYQQNEWNSTATQCASIDTGSGAWSITQANFGLPTNGAPATYPSSYKGCHWGACTTGSGLPIQVSKLGSATTSVSTTQVGSGAYDVAYDIWFNSTPTTSGQPDGTELMIWLNSRGGVQPFGSQTATASLAGMNWAVWTGQQSSWKIISYRLNPGGTSFSNLDVKALINDAVARGSLNPSHYLIDSEFGFEIWQGGQGLGVNSYSFQASAGSGDTTPPTAPTNAQATGVTSNSVSLSWGASTDDVGVTAYDVYQGSTLATTVTGTPPATSATVSGLSPSTAYSFTVKARDAAGNVSQASNTVTATTSAGSSGLPAPTGLAVSGTTASSASLTWNAVSGAASYNVYRNGAKVNGSPVTGTSYTDSGLAASTTYSYTVAAVDSTGTVGAQSGAVNATTSAPAGSWNVSLQAISPNPTHVGTATNVTVDFKNTASSTASNVTLTISVVNSSGAVVGSQSWSGQNIASQQTLNETYTWNPAATGSFTVQAKVSDSGGAVLASNNSVGTVTVQ